MLGKSVHIIMFFIVFNALAQSGVPKTDSVAGYRRSLADCKTSVDTIAWYKANAKVNIQLVRMRNDTALKKLIADTVIIIDTTIKKP